MDDFKKLIYGVLIGFAALIVIFVSFTYFWSCGLDTACRQADSAAVRTPIPTLIPATLPVPARGEAVAFNKCQVAAVNLIAAWVSSGYPEKDPFPFTDVNGAPCEGTYEKDIRMLLNESNLWYSGALACTSCHNPTLSETAAQMDMTTYAGILAGSRRTSADVTGNDILGGGVWEQSKLYEMLVVKKTMPFGRPPDVPEEGPLVFAGIRLEVSVMDATPTPAP